MKKILLTLLALLMIPAVFAVVDVTYTFSDPSLGTDVTTLNASIYNCVDASCSQVTTFSGGVMAPTGQGSTAFSVSDGSLTIRFPSTLNTQGYGLFVTSKGYRPLAIRANWHTGGNPGLGTPQSSHYEFSQMPNTCKATVSELDMVNEVKPHIPLVINTSAGLDASTASAFEFVADDISYMPSEFAQEYYGTDTIVKMEILENGQIVHSQQKEFTAANGNALIAGTSMPVAFSYVPTETGNYLVKVTAQITDDQCAQKEDTDAQGSFAVLAEEPKGEFYTIINDLAVNNTYPKEGDAVMVSYSIISNHADDSNVLKAVQPDVNHTVTLGGNNVFTESKTLFANPDTTTPVTYSFTFVATNSGVYTITVEGDTSSAIPTSKTHIIASETMQLLVGTPQQHKVTFYVKDANTGDAIENANVSISSNTASTNSDGKATLSNVSDGTYTYTVTAENYSTKKSSVTVSTDKVVTALLHPQLFVASLNTTIDLNNAPFMSLPGSLRVQAGVTSSINYHDYVTDEEDADHELLLTVTGGNSDVGVSINQLTGLVSFITNSTFSGSNTISFMLNDTQNKTATDSILITVSSSAYSPALSNLPSVNILEDTSAARVINLRDFTTDLDTPLETMVYSVLSVTPSTLATVEITDGFYLSIFPEPDANGNGTVSVTVSDGTNSDTQNVSLEVNMTNDAPVVISVPFIPNINESENHTVNLTNVFFDADNDALGYSVTPTENITFAISNTTKTLTIIPDANVNGTRQFNVTATDPSGENATAAFTLFINFIDNGPFFTATIPGINTWEETNDSLKLTPYEGDAEEGPGAENNNLIWKIQFANETTAPGTYLNGTLFEAFLTQSTDFLKFVPKKDQVGTRDITLFLFDSTGMNASQNITINISGVNDAPVFANLTDASGEAGQLFTYQANATDAENDSIGYAGLIDPALTGFSVNNSTGLINFTPMINGLFNVTMFACDNSSACSNDTFVLTISDQSSPTSGLETTPTNPSVYAPGANYTFSMNWTDNGNITSVSFEFDGTNYTDSTTPNVTASGSIYSITLSDLAAGNFTYRWHALDNASNLNSTNVSNFVINKAVADLTLLLNGSASDITVSEGDSISIASNLTNTTGTVTITKNGTSIASGTTPVSDNETFSTAGVFNITATFAGDTNYTAANLSRTVTVNDGTAPIFGTQSASPTSPTLYTSLYTFSIDVTDNLGIDTVTFELDNSTNTTAISAGGNTYAANVTSLSIGNHTYKWFANDTAGNGNSTSFSTYIVTQGTAAITLTINGVDGDTSVQANDTATIIANVTNPTGGFVNLYINGTLVQNGTSPITNVTNFTIIGSVPIMAEFLGDANVSAGNVSHTLTITAPITQANHSPASGASFNYSSFMLTLDTSGVTTCAWDTSDVAQGSMANSFSTSNGLSHSANISSLSLGANTISTACNNQSASTNTDLSYTVDNILDGSTLTGVSTVTTSIITSSTLDNVTLTSVNGTSNTLTNVTASDSEINSSILSNCLIQNSTVLAITATDCTLLNGFYDPSNLTGSILNGVTVTDSNVTYSNVTGGTIENSEITLSSITGGSTINNSNFQNATVTGATIVNDQITTGQITVAGTLYDATANGAASLGDVVQVPPQANFNQSSSSVTTGTTVTFTDDTLDPNEAGAVAENLTFLWNFGDGTNATTENATHAYSSTGSFVVTLTVTDAVGFIDTATGSVAVSSAGCTSGCGGGGGGGGSSGGASQINLASTPVTRTVFIGRPLRFAVNGIQFSETLMLRRANVGQKTTEWALGAQRIDIAEGQSYDFDLNGDGVADFVLEVVEVSRNSAIISTSLAAAEVSDGGFGAFGGFFNFPPSTGETPVEEPEPEVVPPPQVDTDETKVDVSAEVEGEGFFSKMSKAFKSLGAKLTPDSVGVKTGVAAAVVVLGLLAYLAFVRWELF